jgi:replicative DNA helicase
MSLEKIVLGTAINDPSTIEEISRLRMSDFSATNRDLFDVILALHNQDALSYRSVVETLRERDLLNFIGDTELGGEEYLKDLLSQADSHGIKAYVTQIEENATRSNLREIAALIAAEASDRNKNFHEVMDHAEQRIFSLRRRTATDEGVEFGELIETYMPFVQGMRDGSIKPAWVPPLSALRNLVQYVHRTEFVILAGRPGDGKSSLLRYHALKTVLGSEEQPSMPVVTFNLENDAFEYSKFAICTLTGINSARLKDPAGLTEEEYDQIKRAAKALTEIPWRLITLSRPRAVEIDRIARKKAAEGYKLIQIDYLQLINNNKNNRVEDLADTTGTLRGIALRTNTPVVAACQLNRAIENRGELAEPMLSDLRESGSIEQDATQVWFIRSMWHKDPTADEITDPAFYFPENFHNTGMTRSVPQAKPVKIYVSKNRNGPTGVTDPIKWNMATGEFNSFTRSARF